MPVLTRRCCLHFNSHTPHGVRLFDVGDVLTSYMISTHTPHTGCDSSQVSVPYLSRNFNSHTPHGVRLKFKEEYEYELDFNSHTPHGVRHGSRGAQVVLSSFQLTHPTRGATWLKRSTVCFIFISTHTPHTGCDSAPARPAFNWQISTHTPHTGCDHTQTAM